ERRYIRQEMEKINTTPVSSTGLQTPCTQPTPGGKGKRRYQTPSPDISPPISPCSVSVLPSPPSPRSVLAQSHSSHNDELPQPSTSKPKPRPAPKRVKPSTPAGIKEEKPSDLPSPHSTRFMPAKPSAPFSLPSPPVPPPALPSNSLLATESTSSNNEGNIFGDFDLFDLKHDPFHDFDNGPSPSPPTTRIASTSKEVIDLTFIPSSPSPPLTSSKPVRAAHAWGPGTAKEPIELSDEAYTKRWLVDYYTCDTIQFFIELGSSTKRGHHRTTFNKFFPYATYHRSTICDQRKKLKKAPLHLKQQAISAGWTYQGQWSTFIQNVKYFEEDGRANAGAGASVPAGQDLIDLS
ncbi:hypothetical protein EST38_g11660, partial [Candolleomyces aberdarensis]